LEKVFSFRADWHQDGRAKPLVRQYQTAVDSAVQSHPELQGCVVCCVYCGIRFLTHPRNAGRRDLRCPFGCRRQHRRECANRRSAAHYAKPEGKRAKKRYNLRRSCRQAPATAPSPNLETRPPALAQPPPTDEPHAAESPAQLRLETVVLDESALARSSLLPYVRMLVRLLDGVKLTCRELLAVLRESLRQRSIGVRRRIDYILGVLHQHPP
jgi:hypothetical protein